jgi:DNA-binding NtrC family response regulator
MKLAGKRLLFVDDERGIRETLSLILLRYGFTVTTAATVEEALAHIKAQSFDLLLCDLNIDSKGDGYTVVRAMREVAPGCVVIVLTGYPDMESADEFIGGIASPETLRTRQKQRDNTYCGHNENHLAGAVS